MLERTMQRSLYVSTTGTWDDFVRERLSRNRRSQLGRARHRLEREGRVELEVADGRERLEEVLEEAFRIEASGWKGRTAPPSPPVPTPGASTRTSPGGPPPRAGSGSPSCAWTAGHWR
jgi:hypothetical protein